MKNICVNVKLFAQYREGKFKAEEQNLKEGTSVENIIKQIGLDIQKFPIGVLMINGRHIDESYILKEGDVLSIFPKVGGG